MLPPVRERVSVWDYFSHGALATFETYLKVTLDAPFS